jgi:hypothetical protein
MKTSPIPKKPSETVTDFMLAEFQILAENRLREIERGQSYVSLFLTIASGAAALLVLVSQSASSSFYLVSIWILFLLLLFGTISFVRVVERDIRIIKHGRSMNRLRRYFVEIDPGVEFYLSTTTNDDVPKYANQGRSRTGLRSIVSLINNSVGASLIYLIVSTSWSTERAITIAAITFVVLWVLHELYASMSWRRADAKSIVRFPSKPNQRM